MWLSALLNLNNPFSSRRNNKSCDIFVFYVPLLWGSFRCNIAATTFSFAAWYVLWVGMWLKLVFVVLI